MNPMMWLGTEAEGKYMGRMTLFVSGDYVIDKSVFESICSMAHLKGAKAIYFGAGGVRPFKSTVLYLASVKTCDIDLVIETDLEEHVSMLLDSIVSVVYRISVLPKIRNQDAYKIMADDYFVVIPKEECFKYTPNRKYYNDDMEVKLK